MIDQLLDFGAIIRREFINCMFDLFDDNTHDERMSASKTNFLNLPQVMTYCSKVDTANGCWYFCGLCNKEVPCRTGRPFTLARWNDHEKCPEHKQHLRRLEELERIKLKKKAQSTKLTSLEAKCLKQLALKQDVMMKFYSVTESQKSKNKAHSTSLSVTSRSVTESQSSQNQAQKNTSSTVIDVESVVDLERVDPEPTLIPRAKRGQCEGIVPGYRRAMKDSITAYCLYASVDSKSAYKVGYANDPHKGTCSQLFSTACKVNKTTFRKHNAGNLFSCTNCEAVR